MKKKPPTLEPQYLGGGGGDSHNILCLLQTQNLLIAEQNKKLDRVAVLLERMVRRDNAAKKAVSRDKGKLRQLKCALDILRDDPLHNINRAANMAYRRMKGYETTAALYQALYREWNDSQ